MSQRGRLISRAVGLEKNARETTLGGKHLEALQPASDDPFHAVKRTNDDRTFQHCLQTLVVSIEFYVAKPLLLTLGGGGCWRQAAMILEQ
jgi:hypothetical protein